MQNLHLDLVRVTEAGAISAAEWVGRGDKPAADRAAVEAMRDRLNRVPFAAEIAIGEGIKDDSFGLFKGEVVGANAILSERPMYSIAVDPIEGTTPTAKGGYEALSVLALAGRGSFFETECFYMNKLAFGPRVVKWARETGRALSLTDPIAVTARAASEALGKPLNRLTVCLLDRPRHAPLIAELRALGCRIKLIMDCDVSAGVAVARPNSGIDLSLGIGGAPEGVITAAALKCLGGAIQCQLYDKRGDDAVRADDRVLGVEDLARGDVMFCATGITNGSLLRGVESGEHLVTHSVAMRSASGTVRWVTTEHGN
ncbi:MAG: fructose-bisphosphatase class II family protein [Planctomycetes bacterium]|nr:fructose-bisphosphatase class II family protein [Planctomycetota bacterium]